MDGQSVHIKLALKGARSLLGMQNILKIMDDDNGLLMTFKSFGMLSVTSEWRDILRRTLYRENEYNSEELRR